MLALLPRLLAELPPSLRGLRWRPHPLDDKLLLFEREYGTHVLIEHEATRGLRRVAPHTLLVAVTNACNLRCPFCYRDQRLASGWSTNSLLALCRAADAWGVLEIAFGGGEPLLFRHWDRFVIEAAATTGLALNFTTNGTLLSEGFLAEIRGAYGQIRLSLYEDNHWPETVRLLIRCRARFGVNWLVTPATLPLLEPMLDGLLDLGVRDILLLRYKGPDLRMHLDAAQLQQLGAVLSDRAACLGPTAQLALDSCWGSDLPAVPRRFPTDDCGAGDAFLSLASDRTVRACSFGGTGIRWETPDELRAIWERLRAERPAVPLAGCPRVSGGGWRHNGGHHVHLDLAPVRQQS